LPKHFLKREPVRIDWGGEQQKDYVYVEDVARASLLAIDHGDNDIFCIATGHGTSVTKFIATSRRLPATNTDCGVRPGRPGDIYLAYFDCSKAGASWLEARSIHRTGHQENGRLLREHPDF